MTWETCKICKAHKRSDSHCAFCGSYGPINVNGQKYYFDRANGKMIGDGLHRLQNAIVRAGKVIGV